MSDRDFELELAIVLALKDPRKELPNHEEQVLFWYAEELELGIGCFRVDGSRWKRDEFELLWNGSIPATQVRWWAYLPEVPEGEGER